MSRPCLGFCFSFYSILFRFFSFSIYLLLLSSSTTSSDIQDKCGTVMKGNTVQGVAVFSYEHVARKQQVYKLIHFRPCDSNRHLKVLSIYISQKMNQTHMHKKENSNFGFQWNFRWLSKRISCQRLKMPYWKALIDSVWLIPKWFMNNITSLSTNHRLHLKSEMLVSPYFTSTVDCSVDFQHTVWTKIVEEIVLSTGPSIISAALAMKYRLDPTNKESYLVC